MPHIKKELIIANAGNVDIKRFDDLGNYNKIGIHIEATGLTAADGKLVFNGAVKTKNGHFPLLQGNGDPVEKTVENGHSFFDIMLWHFEHLVIDWVPGANEGGIVKLYIIAKNY